MLLPAGQHKRQNIHARLHEVPKGGRNNICHTDTPHSQSHGKEELLTDTMAHLQTAEGHSLTSPIAEAGQSEGESSVQRILAGAGTFRIHDRL